MENSSKKAKKSKSQRKSPKNPKEKKERKPFVSDKNSLADIYIQNLSPRVRPRCDDKTVSK